MTQQLPGLSLAAPLPLIVVFLLFRPGKFKFRHTGAAVFLYLAGYGITEVLWMHNFGIGKMIGIGLISAVILFLFLLPALRGSRLIQESGLVDATIIAGWVAFETFTQTWSLSYPLMNLGTTLVEYEGVFTGYAITGATGGTVFLLLLAAVLAEAIRGGPSVVSTGQGVKLAVLVLLATLLFGLGHTEESDSITSVAVLHPNLDVRTDRQRMDRVATSAYYAELIGDVLWAEPETRWIVAPENALMRLGWQEEVIAGVVPTHMEPLRDALRETGASLQIGGFMYKQVRPNARYRHVNSSRDGATSYLTYNTIVTVDGRSLSFLRAKDRLVPFEEFLPGFRWALALIQAIVPRVGATGFYLTSGEKVDHLDYHGTGPLNLICYESLFGFEVAARLRDKPSSLVNIHLNEGWYDNDFGSRKFLLHGMARALESGKYVLRSSNRGDSSIIRGDGTLVANTNTKTNSTYLAARVGLSDTNTPFTAYLSPLIYYGIWACFVLLSLITLLYTSIRSRIGLRSGRVPDSRPR